jgi:hypothetical protein
MFKVACTNNPVREAPTLVPQIFVWKLRVIILFLISVTEPYLSFNPELRIQIRKVN